MEICSIVTRNHLARARVLARSHLSHHPKGRCVAMVVDDFEGQVNPAIEPFDVISPAEAGIEDIDQLAESYEPVALVSSLKPRLLRWMLERAEVAIYLDSDVEVLGSLYPLHRAVRRHGFVLTPHHTAPIPDDGHRPSQTDILRAGVYNGGFLGVARTDNGLRVLDWLTEKLRTDGQIDVARERHADQRWLDLVPALASDLYIERDPGYNVASWNLHERRLSEGPDGILVNGRPLRFFHFSGYSPSEPDRLSVHQTRNDLSDPVLRRLLDSYRAKLVENGWREANGQKYGLPRPTRPLVSPATDRLSKVEGARAWAASELPAEGLATPGPIRRALHGLALRLVSPQTALERNRHLATIEAVDGLREAIEDLDSRVTALATRFDSGESPAGPGRNESSDGPALHRQAG